MRPTLLIVLITGFAVCLSQTGCYYLRVERDKKIACLRRSPVSVRKMNCGPAIFPTYKEPAGYSQTYKDYLFENDPYRQSWEGPPVNVGVNQAMRVEDNSASEVTEPASEELVPEPIDIDELMD